MALLQRISPSLLISNQIARRIIAQTLHIYMYLQDRTRGPNTTLVPIAGIHGKAWTSFSFGIIYCTDDPITEGLEESSAKSDELRAFLWSHRWMGQWHKCCYHLWVQMRSTVGALVLNLSWWFIVVARLIYIFSGTCDQAWSIYSWKAFQNRWVWLGCPSPLLSCST